MTVTVSIAGIPVPIKDRSLQPGDRIEERSRCKFTVRDDAGTMVFSKGQSVSVDDTIQGNLFKGVVNSDSKTLAAGTTRVWHTIDCVDPQKLVDDQVSQKQYTTAQYAGVILVDHVNSYLATDGITAAAALDMDRTQADFATGTLSGTIATNNVDDGDLELAASGSDVGVTMSASTIASFNAIKMVGTAIAGFSNNYLYRKIYVSSPQYTIVSGDFFSYDVWIQSDSPEIKFGCDIQFNDGTTFRDNSTGGDAHGIASHPSNDLSLYAKDTWYTRSIGLNDFIGKKIVNVLIVFEGDSAGTYTGYLRRIYVGNGATHKVDVWTDASTALQTNVLASNSGYTNDQVSIVAAHDKTSIAFHSLNLSAVGLIKGSILSWSVPDLPDGAQHYLQTSLDVGSSRQLVTNNSPVPMLQTGANTSGMSFFVWRYLLQGKDPTAISTIPQSALRVNSAPANTLSGSDVRANWESNAQWNLGTHSGTKSGGQSNLLLNGFQTAFADGASYSGISTVFGTGAPGVLISNSRLALQATSGDARLRLDGYGTWRQDFVAEVDVFVSQGAQIGIEYRTSNWGSATNSFAYYAGIVPTAANQYTVLLGRGSNSGASAGTFTTIQNVTNVKFSDNTWHRLKILIVGDQHTVFVDEYQYLSANDTTHRNTNNIALRIQTVASGLQTSYFKNYGILPMAMSGTWTSPATSIAAANTYGKSVVAWDDSQSLTDGLSYVPQGASIQVQSTVDGGTTWLNCTNGGPIPGLTAGQSLSGKNVQFQAILAAQNANAQPTLGGLSVWVVPQYSASGTRISPALSLAGAGRAGSTLIAWNANTPTNTSIVVESSIDNGTTWQSAINGSAISGIASQSQNVDSFATNTSSQYTNTSKSGGTNATTTWDTTNSRLTMVGGSGALVIYNATSAKDIDVQAILTRSDNGGLVWREADTSNFYELAARDSLASSNPNTLQLYKVVSGTRTAIGSAIAISFTRDTPHIARVTMTGTALTVYFDGAQVLSTTDSSLTAAGKLGLRNDGGTSYVANFRILALGDDVSSKSVKTRTTLTSTDPAVSAQLLDLTVATLGPQIGIGALIQPIDYSLQYVTDVIKDLASKSSYIWSVKFDKSVMFQGRQTTPAPWVLTSKDLLVAGLEVDESADLYRNRQIIKGVVDTIAFSETKQGDGSATSWALSYKLASAPTLMLNGQVATIGQKGIDTGKAFYYEIGSETITQDSTGTKLSKADTLAVTGTGQYERNITVDNTSLPGTVTQSQYAAITGGSGIVTMIEDVSGQGLNTTAATALATSLLQKFGVIGRTIKFRTLHAGLAVGQYQPAFVPEFALLDQDFLLTEVALAITGGDSTLQFWWSVTGVSGPNLGSWSKLMESITN